MAKDYTLEKRKLVIGGVAIVIVIIYIMRLFVLQIMTDTYKKNADSNAFLNKIQYPSCKYQSPQWKITGVQSTCV